MKSWKDILSAPHFTYEEMIEEGTELDKKYNLPLDEMESPGVCYMRIDDIFDNPYQKEIYRNKDGGWSQINLNHIKDLWEGANGVTIVGGLQEAITIYVDSRKKKGGHHRRLMYKRQGFIFIAVKFAMLHGQYRLWSEMSESEKIKDLTGDNQHVQYPEPVHVKSLIRYSEVLESEGYKMWSPEWTEEMLLQKGSKISGEGLDILKIHWILDGTFMADEVPPLEGTCKWGGRKTPIPLEEFGEMGCRLHPDGTPIQRKDDDLKRLLAGDSMDKSFTYFRHFKQMIVDSNNKWQEETKYKQGDFDPKFNSMIGDINNMYPFFGGLKKYIDESLIAHYSIPDNGMYNGVEWKKPTRLEERSACTSYRSEELLMEHMKRAFDIGYIRETTATQHLDLVLSKRDEFGEDIDVKVTGAKANKPTFTTNALKLCDNVYIARHPEKPYHIFAAAMYTLPKDYGKESSFAVGTKRKISTKNLYLGINDEIENNGKMYKRGHVLLGDINTEKKLTGKGSKSTYMVTYFDIRKLDMRVKKLIAEDKRQSNIQVVANSFIG